MRTFIAALLLVSTTSAFAVSGGIRPQTPAQAACKGAPPILRDICIWGYENLVPDGRFIPTFTHSHREAPMRKLIIAMLLLTTTPALAVSGQTKLPTVCSYAPRPLQPACVWLVDPSGQWTGASSWG